MFMVLMLFWSAYNSTRWASNEASVAALENFTGKAGSGYMIPQSFTPYNNNDNGTLYNIYDTIYFDKANGNLVIDASANVQIYNRINVATATYTSYQARDDSNNLTSRQTTESQIKMPSGAISSWTCKLGTYQITYIPFNNDTYIHLMDISGESSVIVLSAYFTDPAVGGGGTQEYYLWTSSDSSSEVGKSLGVTSGTYKGALSTGDGANTTEPFYDATAAVFQISQDVKYDLTNGNLLIENVDATGKTITVYPRASTTTATYTSSNNAGTLGGKTPSSSVTTLVSTVKKPIFAADPKQTNFVIYWPVMNNTIIAVYKAIIDGAEGGVDLVSVSKAVGNALYVGGSSAPPATIAATSSASAVAAGSATVALPPGMDTMMANYFKWFSTFNQEQNDKYILKSAIVPPVCPAQNCPSCNCTGGASCASCKTGVSGTGYASSVAAGSSSVGSGSTRATTGGGTSGAHGVKSGSSGSHVDTDGNVIEDSIRGVGSLGSDVVRNTGNLASDAIRGTAGFAKESVENTASAMKESVGYVGTGVGNFLSNLTKSSPTQVGGAYGGSGGGAYGGSGGGGAGGATGAPGGYRADVYSYGGAVNSQYENQKTDPRPVIADFSKFAR